MTLIESLYIYNYIFLCIYICILVSSYGRVPRRLLYDAHRAHCIAVRCSVL